MVDVPAQALPAALVELGNETGLQVSVGEATVADKRSAAVTGRMTPTEALSLMLSGSGLSFRSLGSDGAVVVETDAADSNVEAAVRLAPIVVEATRLEDPLGPADGYLP
ncbi:MAG: STN domain-containing protein [Pseudomonadota bacterium]